jgi:hypothetical protein
MVCKFEETSKKNYKKPGATLLQAYIYPYMPSKAQQLVRQSL